MSTQLDDLEYAARFREVVRDIATQTFQDLSPRPRYATVISTDPGTQTVELQFPDEVGNTFWVPSTAIMPQTGSTVRVAGYEGARYIDEIQLGNVRVNGDLDVVGDLSAGGVAPSGLGTMAIQDADNVNIIGGSITGLTALGIGDGSVGTPLLKFNLDTDTGMYRVGSGTIGFSSNGVQSLALNASTATFAGAVRTGAVEDTAGTGTYIGLNATGSLDVVARVPAQTAFRTYGATAHTAALQTWHPTPVGAAVATMSVAGALTLSAGLSATTGAFSSTIDFASVTGAGLTWLDGRYVNHTDGYVQSVQGTANQVLVNATSGSAQTGALTLTLPTAITAPGSLTVTTGLNVTGAGTFTGQGIFNASIGVFGGDSNTNLATKRFRIAARHYTNAEEPVAIAIMTSSVSDSLLTIGGGGTGVTNAATEIDFFTAANNTTVIGTSRMSITSSLISMLTATTFSAAVTLNSSVLVERDNGTLMTLNRPNATAGTQIEIQQNGVNKSHIGFLDSTGGGSLSSGLANAGFIRGDDGLHLTTSGNAGAGVTINTANNVGVGTITPSAKLDVIGTLAVSGVAALASNLTVTGTVISGGLTAFSLPNGAGSNFTPGMQRLVVSGAAGFLVGVRDGTSNYRAGLFADLTNNAVGLSWDAASGTPPFIIRAPGGIAITVSMSTRGVTLGSTLDVTGVSTFTSTLQDPSYASQTTGWAITSNGALDFRFGFFDALHARVFTADLEQVLAGRLMVAKSQSKVAQAFVVPAAGGAQTLWVEDLPDMPNVAVFEPGDYVSVYTYSRAGGGLTIGDAVGVVTGYTSGTGANEGTQSWIFTRVSGAIPGDPGTLASGVTILPKALVVDFGTSGNGVFQINAADGAYNINGPYSQVVTWTVSPAMSNWVVRSRIGNLRGLTAVTGEYGAIFGVWATRTTTPVIRASTSGVELYNVDLGLYLSGTRTIWLDPATPKVVVGSGTNKITLTGTAADATTSISIGTGGYNTTGQFFWVDASGRMSLKQKLVWDGSNLTIDGGGTFSGALSAATGTFSGTVTVGQSLTIGSGTNKIIASSTATDATTSIGIGTGGYNTTGQFFWVDASGRMSLKQKLVWDGSNLTIAGALNAATGTFSGTITVGQSLFVGSGTNKITLVSTSSDATTAISIGTGGYNTTGQFFWVDGSGRMSLKQKFVWDGSNLTIDGSGTFSGAVTASSGSIGGWSIGTSAISSSGTNPVALRATWSYTYNVVTASADHWRILDATGAVDIGSAGERFRIQTRVYLPAAALMRALVSKYGAAGQRSFYFAVTATDALTFVWTNDGTTTTNLAATSAAGLVTAYEDKWVWLSMDWEPIGNGAASWRVRFYVDADAYEAPAAPTLVDTQTGSVAGGTIFNSTDNLRFVNNSNTGASNAAWFAGNGRMYRTKITNLDTSTTVVDVNFTGVASGATTFNESGPGGLAVSRSGANVAIATQPAITIGSGSFGGIDTPFMASADGVFALGNSLMYRSNTLTLTGSILGGSLQIGGDDATSFQVDSTGGIWSGASVANKATAPFRVSNAGVLTASSGTIGGWALAATTLSAGGITLNSSTGEIAVVGTDTTLTLKPTTITGRGLGGIIDFTGTTGFGTIRATANISMQAGPGTSGTAYVGVSDTGGWTIQGVGAIGLNALSLSQMDFTVNSTVYATLGAGSFDFWGNLGIYSVGATGLNVGHWLSFSGSSGYYGMFRSGGVAGNYMIIANTTDTYISTAGSTGNIYLRPSDDTATYQMIITDGGLHTIGGGLTHNAANSHVGVGVTKSGGAQWAMTIARSDTSTTTAFDNEGVGGNLYLNTTISVASAVVVRSDLKFKRAIEPIESPLDKLRKLKPRQYMLRADRSNRLKMGFVAQDLLESDFASLVHDGTNGGKDMTDPDGNPRGFGIEYEGLIAPTIAAVQEQDAEITNLKMTVQAQADQLAALTAQLEAVQLELAKPGKRP